MSKPSIANISFSTAWGGLEMSSVKTTRLFAQAGYPSYEFCQPETPIHKTLSEQGLEAQALKVRDYFSPTASLAIRRTVRERRTRAVFLHSLKDIWLVAPALWNMPEVKLFGFARMLLAVSKTDPLHRLMYSRLNGMIALSHIQKNLLLPRLPLPESKYIVIPNGVDVERFQPRPRRDDIRASWGIAPEHTLFGLIGRLDRQKGSLEFVEAAAQVLRDHPEARFVLVGGNTLGEGDFDQQIRARLRDLNLGDKVVLTDYRSDIPDVMNALDVFVLPSYEENFGNVTLEALASGVPVIGTNAGGTPEILEDGAVGLLCAPRSSEALATSMRDLLTNPALRDSLRDKARQKALRDFDMKRVFARIEALAN